MKKGTTHSKETKERMSLAKKSKTWEEIFGVEEAERRRAELKNTLHKPGRKRPDIVKRNKESNPMWDMKTRMKSSISHTIDGKYLYEKYRDVLKKNGCVVCGKMENLHTHHRDKNKLNNKISNLVCLCAKCHMGIHKNNIQE